MQGEASTTTMAACVACSKPLILHIEPEEDDEDISMAASSTNAGKDVDDDVQLQCGCHFHWSVRLWSSRIFAANVPCFLGNASLTPIP